MHKFKIPEPIIIVDGEGRPVKKAVSIGGRDVATQEDDASWTFQRFFENIILTDAAMTADSSGKSLGRKAVKATNRVRRALKDKQPGDEALIDSEDRDLVLKVMNDPGSIRPMSFYSQFEPFLEAWEAAEKA